MCLTYVCLCQVWVCISELRCRKLLPIFKWKLDFRVGVCGCVCVFSWWCIYLRPYVSSTSPDHIQPHRIVCMAELGAIPGAQWGGNTLRLQGPRPHHTHWLLPGTANHTHTQCTQACKHGPPPPSTHTHTHTHTHTYEAINIHNVHVPPPPASSTVLDCAVDCTISDCTLHLQIPTTTIGG